MASKFNDNDNNKAVSLEDELRRHALDFIAQLTSLKESFSRLDQAVQTLATKNLRH
jgi:hypothetical protein